MGENRIGRQGMLRLWKRGEKKETDCGKAAVQVGGSSGLGFEVGEKKVGEAGEERRR